MRVEKGGLFFEAFGQGHVVVIHDGEILASRHVHESVAGPGNAEIAFVFGIDDARIMKRAHHLFEPLHCGAVVENEQLKIREGLRQHALHGLAQMFGTGVVYGHEDGNFRHAQPLCDKMIRNRSR